MDRINSITAAAGAKYTSALLLWHQTAPYQRAEMCRGAIATTGGAPAASPCSELAQCGDLELRQPDEEISLNYSRANYVK